MGTKSPDRVDVEVGRRIRELRIAAGLTQGGLAAELGLTFQQVQKYEKGQNRVGAGRLTKIADVLQIPVVDLLGIENDTKNEEPGVRNPSSPFQFLGSPGALRLLRAFGRLQDAHTRRTIVEIVEKVAFGRTTPLRR